MKKVASSHRRTKAAMLRTRVLANYPCAKQADTPGVKLVAALLDELLPSLKDS